MSKIVQVRISDKILEFIDESILEKRIVDYSGNYLNKRSTVAAYLIDLGMRVIKSSKEKESINVNEFRAELFKRVLQNLQLSKSIIQILNRFPENQKTNLLNEYFNENVESISWIETEMRKFFSDD